jgi:hypothetical protein
VTTSTGTTTVEVDGTPTDVSLLTNAVADTRRPYRTSTKISGSTGVSQPTRQNSLTVANANISFTVGDANISEIVGQALDQPHDALRFPDYRVAGMRKWEGRIISVDGEFFTAELTPTTPGPTVNAEFELDLIGDEPDVGQGDVVYVTVRTVKGLSGLPVRTSAIRLRRLGKWSEDEVAELRSRGARVRESMDEFIER